MLIPDNIKHFDSYGEKILYNRIKRDPSAKGMYVLHSVFTNNHFKNISGELDFLLLVPGQGIFALEVKHGGVSRKRGTWHFQNRFGDITTRNKSPFAQVDGTMNSIRKFLLDKIKQYGENTYKRLSKLLWGSGVVFTSMDDFVDFGLEGHSWQVLTKTGLRLPFGDYVGALSKGWHNTNRDKYWYDANMARPTDKDCRLIIRILRGDFNVDYGEINRITDNDQLIEEYTKEQFELLDYVDYNDRCLVQGAAGTGKTIMAMEVFRRKVAEGKKIGLFCFNRRLGEKIRSSLMNMMEEKPGSFIIGTFHSFLMQQVNTAEPEDEKEKSTFFSEGLPLEYLLQIENVSEDDKLDFLILDEAQDLSTPAYLEVFDEMLKGGLEDGKWIFFGDFNRQAIYLDEHTDPVANIRSVSSFTSIPPLKVNCRNAKDICVQNTLLTGVDLPNESLSSIAGCVADIKFPSKNKQVDAIEELFRNLIDEGTPLKDIVLLSPKKFENSVLASSPYMNDLLNQGLDAATIQAYKGLENTIVVLFGFEDMNSRVSQNLLYVGVSRARQRLYIVFEKSLEEDFKLLVQSNASKLDNHGH
jgi:hypothetical protein